MLLLYQYASTLPFFLPRARALPSLPRPHSRLAPPKIAAADHTAQWRIKAVSPEHYFHHLAREIIYQRLSGKAAGTIFGRFEALLPDKKLSPAAVLQIPLESLRSAGLSNAKATYIHALATAVQDNQLNFPEFPTLNDEAIITQLTSVKGIGRWTAEMFLMFAMGRENVFSYGDLGLRKGFQRAYNLPELPTIKEMMPIVENWSPYKTYASVALWASLEIGS